MENRLGTLHIMWDGIPWGRGYSERVPTTFVRRWTGHPCIPFRMQKVRPSGVLFVIAAELVVCTLGV